MNSFRSINRTWFRNQLRKENLLVKCTGKYSDDYAYDNETNFSREKDFKKAGKDMFEDWYIDRVRIYGDKEGEISVVFASCEYYTFKVNKDEK